MLKIFLLIYFLFISTAHGAQLQDTIVTGNLTVNGNQDAIQLKVQGNATQTNFLMTLEQSDGTDQVTISNDGATTVTGILTVVERGIFGGTGDSKFTSLVVLKKVTSDPCTAGEPEGSIFYNDTANEVCFCNGTDDLRIKDATTACF